MEEVTGFVPARRERPGTSPQYQHSSPPVKHLETIGMSDPQLRSTINTLLLVSRNILGWNVIFPAAGSQAAGMRSVFDVDQLVFRFV